MTISRNQLRAARMLLCLSQQELAALSDVAVVTIRRYEAGRDAPDLQIERLRSTVEKAGAILLGTADVCGRDIGDGIALAADELLPSATRDRLLARVAGAGVVEGRGRGRPPKRKA